MKMGSIKKTRKIGEVRGRTGDQMESMMWESRRKEIEREVNQGEKKTRKLEKNNKEEKRGKALEKRVKKE